MKIKFGVGVFAVIGLLAFNKARAEQAVAIAPNNTLVLFDTATPSTTTTRAITGLGGGEKVRGIDYRPAAGHLQISTVVSGSASNSIVSTYRVDPSTGAATLIGTTGIAPPGAGDVPTGYDFNPTVDRIRIVNANDENFRVNPNNATLSGDDPDLTPAATSTIIAAAYDRNSPGGPANTTTLYVIDRNDSKVGIQGGINQTPSPNGGVITDLCPLGFTLHATNDGGFDVSPVSGTAFAALTDAATNATNLYTITLPTAVTATPCATLVGQIGAGTEIYSLTIFPPDFDGDGTRDPLDGCGTDPAKTAPGTCGCGVPDVDTDADGTLDCNDACPNDAAKIVAGACGCGIADTDTDADGTPDCIDGCPDDVAKIATGACGCGVADTDANGNGVADCNDPPANTPCGACGAGGAFASLTLLSLFAARARRQRTRRQYRN